MPVIARVTAQILSSEDLKELESQVVQLETLEQRKIRASDAIKTGGTANSGIFASTEGEEALPSNIIRKRRKLEEQTSRASDSILAGLDKAKDKKSATAIVRKSEFTDLKNKVTAQEGILGKMQHGQGAIQGIAGLSTPNGILSAGTGLISRIPQIAIVMTAAKIIADKYIGQFGAGGTKDTRVQITDEANSNIGVQNESDVLSGRKLFLSNPLKNQGLPAGNSNTQNIRDGIRIYNLRQEGSYQ